MNKKRQFAVIGLGNFGMKLAEELARQGACVIVIDKDISKIEQIQDVVSLAVQMENITEKALKECGIKEVDVVIVGMGGKGTETSILTTKILKEMKVKEVIVRAIDSLHARILKTIGADKIIFPEEEAAQNLARSILIPGVKEYVKLKGPWDLSEVEIGQGSSLIGRELESLEARKKYQVNILMITRIKNSKEIEEETKEEEERIEKEIREEEEVVGFPDPNYILKEGDILIIYGKEEQLKKFEKFCAD